YASGEAVATGHVSLTRGSERILADRLTYHRGKGTFTADRVRLGRFPYFVSGRRAEGTATEVTVYDAVLSVREPGPWQPTVIADPLTYVRGEELVAANARIGVGRLQPVAVPKFTYKLNLPLVSYLSFTAGYRASLGAFVESGVNVPVGTATKVGASLGAYTQRGFMVGPTAHYERARDGREAAGDLKSGFINDHGDKLTDVIGRPVPENRGYLQWWHAQDLTPRLSLTGQLNYWSDSEILRDFRPDEFFGVQEPDNYLQAVHAADRYFVNLFSRFRPNDFQPVQERLPEVQFSLPATSIGGGFFARVSAGAAALREEPPGGGGVMRSDRLDAYAAVTRPLARADWFSFTPIVGARATHYARATGGRDTYTRMLGEFGFDAELRAAKTWDYQNPVWKIDGIRHLLTPVASYRYVPGAEKGRAWIPAIDEQTFGTYLPVIGLGDIRSIDDLDPHHVLRVGLNNTWQTRDATYGSRDLLVLNLANDFRFDRLPGQRRSSDLHAFLAFTPSPWLQFDFYQRTTVADLTLQEFNTGLTIRDGDAWAMRFSSHFLRQEIDEYILAYEQRLNESLAVLTKLHYDTRRKRFNEQAFGLRQNLGNTWAVRYYVSVYDGPRRESNFGFNIAVEALGF
ncbi:MAG: LPS assembly protein LptD, partial [Cephaloticoccus sp.]